MAITYKQRKKKETKYNRSKQPRSQTLPLNSGRGRLLSSWKNMWERGSGLKSRPYRDHTDLGKPRLYYGFRDTGYLKNITGIWDIQILNSGIQNISYIFAGYLAPELA